MKEWWLTSQQTQPKAQASDACVRLKGILGGGSINSGAIHRVEPARVDDFTEVSEEMNAASPKSVKRACPS
jgi:hypothetical protein